MSVFLSPPTIAKRLGVAPEKVHHWIRSGQLRAVNIATNLGGRARWAVHPDDLERFLAARQATPPAPRPQRRRIEKPVVDYLAGID